MSSDEPRPPSRSGSTADRDDRLRELGTVTGELLHDLGGVLSILSARVALAVEEARLGRIPNEELGRIQRDADELSRMVREILDELRGARTSPEVSFRLAAAVEREVERWLVRAPSVHVVLDSSLPEHAQIAGPRSFFSRAIGNLLANAARHARSEVRVSVRPASERTGAEVQIEDDGDGIADEIRERMFAPFASAATGPAEHGGTGLGLSFTRWSIERLGGSLVADSDPSRLGGASFRLVVPLWTGPSTRDTGSGPVERAYAAEGEAPDFGIATEARPGYGRGDGNSLEGVRLAVVEDDPGVRRVFSRLLRRSGADVFGMDPAAWRTLDDGVQALREYGPHAILLDVNLEVMSGLDLYSRLRESEPALAEGVLFLTGGAAPAEPLDRPLVNKMIVWDELVASVRRVVRPPR